LPVEPDPPSRRKRWLGLAGASALAAAILVFIQAGRGSKPPAPEIAGSAPGDLGIPRPSKKEPGGVAGGESRDSAEERQAMELYQAAEKYERSDPAEYEQRAARWREVVARFPTTTWARKADEKHKATTASLQSFLDREFE